MRGIRYLSHPGNFGYAEAARRYIIGLVRAGVPVTWSPVVPINAEGTKFEVFKGSSMGDQDLDPFCNAQISYDTVIVHVLPRAVEDCLLQISAKTLVGYVAWDTNQLPAGWVKKYGIFDSLLVPCLWNKQVFQRGGISIPVRVVPHLFSDINYSEDSLKVPSREAEFIFYTIGTWTQRKGTLEVVKAYLKAFTARDKVKLVIKTEETKTALRSSIRSGLVKQVKQLFNWPLGGTHIPLSNFEKAFLNSPNTPKIELITDQVPKSNILQLHHQGDCYVSLTKGEAWGLGAFDAAGFGKPVIITGIGGPLEYLDIDSAYLLNYREQRLHDKSVKEWAKQKHYWAVPDINQAAETMRHIYNHRHEAFQKGKMLRKNILENFSEQTVIQRMLAALVK